jgi:hypothetical protein
MRFRSPLPVFFLLLVGISVFISCRKQDKTDTSSALMLSFSSDTVYFDSVFTTIGSITQRMTVYNRNDHKVNISSIRLAGGEASEYRLNIDGLPLLSTSNLEIPGNDSIFIFIRVTVDPSDKDLPFIVADSILFLTNGNNQQVKLVAWGQNARFLKYETLRGNQTWDSIKPWVVYGYVRVDTGASLTILPGTKIYFHFGSYMAVSLNSSLKVQGNLEHPVGFRGDRLDPYYRDLPGQWKGIYLERGSIDNTIDYAVVKNGIFGFSVDSLSVGSNPVLTISNTRIENTSSDAIYAYATNIVGTNVLLGNCGGSALAVDKGGSYDFRQMTIANYWSASVRLVPSLYLSNFIYDTAFHQITNPLLKAYFGNSILYGSSDNEITIDSASGVPCEYTFDHCILKTTMNTGSSRFVSCLKNEDPLFVDPQNFDFHIDSLSPAIGVGTPMGVPFDLDGNLRGDPPDLGAYQWIPKR